MPEMSKKPTIKMLPIKSGFNMEYLNFLLMQTPISKATKVRKMPNNGELMMVDMLIFLVFF